MTPLKELLELYKAMLRTDVGDVKPMPVSACPPPARVSVDKENLLENPKPGDMVEIVPPYDNLEMVFLILREVRDSFEIVPLSRFWQFATPKDVVLKVGSSIYIAQTDLSFDVLKESFTRRFGNAFLFKIGEVDPKTLRRIERVSDGKEKGDGGMWGGVKGEFKSLEAKRWFGVFSSQIAEEEFLQALNAVLKDLKEELPLAASEQESVRGEKEGIVWFYDEEEEVLIIVPREELIGSKKKIYLDIEGEKFIIFEGKLPEKIEIPLKREAYSYRVLTKWLRVEDA